MQSFKKMAIQPPSVDLKYYSLSFQDKQREAKRKEKELLNAIAEKEILKIKRTPWIAFTSGKGIVNETKIDEAENGLVDNYFVDLLTFSHLLAIKEIPVHNFQLLRLLFPSSSSDGNGTKVHGYVKKSGILQALMSIFGSSFYYVRNFVQIFRQVCVSFICRTIGVYFCFKLRSRMQRFIVPLKDVGVLRKLSKLDNPVVYFLKHRTPYYIVLFIYLLYWNNIRMPAVFLPKNYKPWICWILRNMGMSIINVEALEKEDGIVDYHKLRIQIEKAFETKRAVMFCLQLSHYDIEIADLIRTIMKANCYNAIVSDTIFTTVTFSSENVSQTDVENALLFKGKTQKNCYNFGIVQAKIGVPFSLREIITSSRTNSSSQMATTRNELITKRIITCIDFEFSKSQVLMSTSLVSFIMLYKFRDGVKFDDLVKTVDSLRNELIYHNKPLAFTGRTENVVKHAIKILDKKLEVNETNHGCVIKPVLHLLDVVELSHLSNIALNYFVLEAAIMTCLHVQFKSRLEDAFKSGKNSLTFYYNEFVEKIEQLCEILQTHFFFIPPNQNLSTEISNALFKLIENEYFMKDEKFLTDEERWGYRFAKHLESDDDDEDDAYYSKNRGDLYSVNFEADSDLYQKIMFLRKPLQPIIDAYIVIIDNLRTLTKTPTIHQELVKQILFKLKSSFDDSRLKYPESVSLELVVKSIELWERSNILKSYTVDGIKIYYFNEENGGIANLANMEYKIKYFQQ